MSPINITLLKDGREEMIHKFELILLELKSKRIPVTKNGTKKRSIKITPK